MLIRRVRQRHTIRDMETQLRRPGPAICSAFGGASDWLTGHLLGWTKDGWTNEVARLVGAL